MIRLLFGATVAALIALSGAVKADEVRGIATVNVQDPKKGSIPNVVYAYGMATPTQGATATQSFQRDGQVSDILVEVGDQFKMGDKLLDFGASPAAVVQCLAIWHTWESDRHRKEKGAHLTCAWTT